MTRMPVWLGVNKESLINRTGNDTVGVEYASRAAAVENLARIAVSNWERSGLIARRAPLKQ